MRGYGFRFEIPAPEFVDPSPELDRICNVILQALPPLNSTVQTLKGHARFRYSGGILRTQLRTIFNFNDNVRARPLAAALRKHRYRPLRADVRARMLPHWLNQMGSTGSQHRRNAFMCRFGLSAPPLPHIHTVRRGNNTCKRSGEDSAAAQRRTVAVFVHPDVLLRNGGPRRRLPTIDFPLIRPAPPLGQISGRSVAPGAAQKITAGQVRHFSWRELYNKSVSAKSHAF